MDLRLIGYWAERPRERPPVDAPRRTRWSPSGARRSRLTPPVPENDEPSVTWPDPAAFVDTTWSTEERSAVASYLDAGEPVLLFCGISSCRLCGGANGCGERSDGSYLWPDGLTHYVRDHSVRLPDEVLQHVLRQQRIGDRAPIDTEAIQRMPLDTVWWRTATVGAVPADEVATPATRSVPIVVLLPDRSEAHWTCDIEVLSPFRNLCGRYACRMSVRSSDEASWSADDGDPFDCLMGIRRQLEPLGYRVCCNGARRNAWRSPMSGDESMVLLLDARPEPRHMVCVPTLGAAPASEVTTVDDQIAWCEASGHLF
jgi:hypothetical protein